MGEGIAAGQAARGLRIEDVGPTLASWLGVEVPDVDGRPFDYGIATRSASSISSAP